MTSPRYTRIDVDQVSSLGPVLETASGDYATATQFVGEETLCEYPGLQQALKDFQHAAVQCAGNIEENIKTHQARLINAVTALRATDESFGEHLHTRGGHK